MGEMEVPDSVVAGRARLPGRPQRSTCGMGDPLSAQWDHVAAQWTAWAREPDHDSYWTFHRRRFLELVPAAGKLTVDVGCGEGRVGRDLVRRGHNVVGVDSSSAMVQACVAHPDGHPALVGDAARLPLGSATADVIVAFMALHDVDDLEGAVGEAARVLDGQGRLHVAIVHPINSAGSWSGDATHGRGSFVIDDSYMDSFTYSDHVERDGLEMTFHSRHRPLTSYARALAGAGFVIERLEEVTDAGSTSKWARVPLFLHIVARRL